MNGAARVTGNSATYIGGGVIADVAPVTMGGNARVSNNTSEGNGGRIALCDASLAMSSKAQVNSNSAPSGWGGGVFGLIPNCTPNSVSMTGTSQVDGNHAGVGGGGIYLSQNNGTVTLNKFAQVNGNTSDQFGAGDRRRDRGHRDPERQRSGEQQRDASERRRRRHVHRHLDHEWQLAGEREHGREHLRRISNACSGSVTMTGASEVKYNIAGVDAGGINNFGGSTLVGAVDGGNVASNSPNNIVT